MTDFKIGDVVWVRAKIWDRGRHPDRLMLEVGNGEVIAGESDCKPYAEPDLKQAIREVLLSGEFLGAFAAAWMKTPLPIAIPPTKRDRELIESLKDYPFVEPATETTNGPT